MQSNLFDSRFCAFTATQNKKNKTIITRLLFQDELLNVFIFWFASKIQIKSCDRYESVADSSLADAIISDSNPLFGGKDCRRRV